MKQTIRIEMYKENTIWNYMVYTPGKGSFGSCNRGSKKEALRQAMMHVPTGSHVQVVTL